MSIFSILNKAARATGLSDELAAVARKAVNVGEERNRVGLDRQVVSNPYPQFDIDRFTSEIGRTGLVQNNRFTVQLSPPEVLVSGKIHNALTLRCFASALPGKQLMMKDDIRRHGFGQIDKVPHNTLYTDVVLSFFIDAKGEIPEFFHNWLSYIQRADSVSRLEESVGASLDRPTNDYLVEYKENYAGPLTIKQLNSINENVYGVRLNQAFPISIGDQQLAWDQNNSLAILPVTFTYLDYTVI